MSLIESSQVSVVEERATACASPFAATRSGWGQLHWTLLLLSSGVLAAALVLRVEYGMLVSIPWLGMTLPELCYWRTVFGVDCPGCGLTRCFVSLAHADPAAAWRYNPVGILLFAGVVFQLPYRTLQLWRLRQGRPELDVAILPWALVGICLLLVVQWLVRVML
jgi:hypothetical protein